MKIEFHKHQKTQRPVKPAQTAMREAKSRKLPILRIIVLLGVSGVLAGVVYMLLRAGNVYTYGIVSAKTQEFRAPFSGKITGFRLERGDVVKKGDPLFRLVSQPSEQEYQALKELREQLAAKKKAAGTQAEETRLSAVQKARIEVNKLTWFHAMKKKDYERLLELRAMDAALKSEVEAASSAMRLALYNLEQAKVDLAAAERETADVALQQAEVDVAIAKNQPRTENFHAGFDGIVLELSAVEGSLVAAQDRIMTVADTADLWVDAYIPSQQAEIVKKERQVIVYAEGAGRKFSGTTASRADSAAVVKTPEILRSKMPGESTSIYTRVNLADTTGLLPGTLVRLVIRKK